MGDSLNPIQPFLKHTEEVTEAGVVPKTLKQDLKPMDGNEAATTIAYACSDVAFIYPITPSSTMAELADAWAAAGKLNVFGEVMKVTEMESEAGAAGALHGALAAGALGVTFTASQGLLLMIPNMYKIAGELMPCVMHVAARALAGQALSIFGDHSDVMAVRQTGWALLSSHTVQECMDLALVAHLATLKASVPFLHFFDGFRLSHEVNKIRTFPTEEIKPLLDQDAMQRHRERAMNPLHPTQRGTSQGPDIFFQMVESANKYYNEVPNIVQAVMVQVYELTGRKYHLFDYVGAEDADRIVIMMGGGSPVVEEAMNYLNAKGQKLGLIKVRLYRPWDAHRFIASIPKSVKRICILDRTKESGALAEPLYLDVCSTLLEYGVVDKVVVGGRFGLGSKEFTPAMAAAVYDNLCLEKPKNHFTVGINDDVTFLSLPIGEDITTVPPGTTQCLFWGMGSDGTVGANKDAVKIIADNTDLYAQAYFAYDAHKSGGVTVSHLRFGPLPITSQYLITEADFIAVSLESYVHKYDFLSALKPGGVVALNTVWTPEDLENRLPGRVRRQLAKLKPRFYIINARQVSDAAGLGKRINQVMQTVFFYLSGVLPFEKAIGLLKKAIQKTYGKKGPEIVAKNYKCVDDAIRYLKQIEIPDHWADAPMDDRGKKIPGAPDFVNTVIRPMLALEGDKLPVSVFTAGGFVPPGTTKYEKRSIASQIPIWKPDNCSQCNYCAFVCPHAAIRPCLATEEELDSGAPETFETRKAKGTQEIASFKYRIQVSPFDCTGCELCTQACPDNALQMKDVGEVVDVEAKNWEFLTSLPSRGDLFDKTTVKGSQFQKPLMEFSGACEGCGETPYVKLLTQLFGDRMLVANATGCSSIWGGSAPVNPYTTNDEGRGPAWANSLFEDNAEFGFGICTAALHRRKGLIQLVEETLKSPLVPMTGALREALQKWLSVVEDADKCKPAAKTVEQYLAAEKSKHPALLKIFQLKDLLPKLSVWIIGGDGWAYDIGYGGLDHVLASGEKVNVLVLDTEMYSNTGGQMSKSTPVGSVALFASSGKRRQKKDLGMLAMQYGDVYVASVCLDANYTQVVRAFCEAEAYPGPSLIIAYSPCMLHGLRDGMKAALDECKMAVETGYWSLYRFDPALDQDTRFQLDSKKIKPDIEKFLSRENRFGILKRSCPKQAEDLQHSLTAKYQERHRRLKEMADHTFGSQIQKLQTGMMPTEDENGVPLQVIILYGSETGNSEGLAHALAKDIRSCGVPMVKVMSGEEMDIQDLPSVRWLVVITSTAGQGEFPENLKEFYHQLTAADLPADFLKGLNYSVFGLGDSSYCFFCKAAELVDRRLEELGANRLLARGFGDDQDPDKYETGFANWAPDLWASFKLPEPKEDDGIPNPGYEVTLEKSATVVPLAAKPILTEPWARHIQILSNERITPLDYDRDIRHIVLDLEGSKIKYSVGDALAIYPRNDPEEVKEFLHWYGLDPYDKISLKLVNEGNKPKPALPPGCTVLQLFTDVLDIFGRPSLRFYKALSKFAGEEDERKQLLALVNRHPIGRAAYAKLLEETPNFADIIRRYPTAKPSLPHLVDMIPILKPRYYSIASSQHIKGNHLELCIVIVDWKTPSGKLKYGTCTNYLRKLTKGTFYLAAALKPSAGMCMPSKTEVPVVMAALGTGLAPMRAMAQEREYQQKAGKKTGETVLFFGCRHRAKDYLYGNEWDDYLQRGVCSHLRIAFSRDQKEKIYIQHKIEQEPELLWDLLVQKHGYFFFCGPARQAPNDIRAAVESAFMKAGHLTHDEASHKIDELMVTGHYVVEAWS